MNTYYVPFYPAESIDYLTLLAFYDIAEYNSTTQVFDTIHYQSIRSLAEVLGLSTYAVNTALNGGKYEKYLSIDKAQKTITIKNCFTRSQKSLTPFVVLKHNEVELLRKQKDNLFCRYLVYLKYYTNHAKGKQTDFTGKQFLTACGYSGKSHSYLNKLNDYNKILTDNKIVKIEKYRDELGHTRNRYNLL